NPRTIRLRILMQSADKNIAANFTPNIARKTIWLLVAIALNALELFIPRIPFLPWLKPGIANAVTIIWIIRFGVKDAVLYTILRSWISSFYFGLSFLTIILSISGGVLATLAMGGAWKWLGKKGLLGTTGMGIIGALFHNVGQLVTVYFVLTRNTSVFYQFPFMCAASVVFGGVAGGIIMPILWHVINDRPLSHALSLPVSATLDKYTAVHVAVSLFVLVGCVSLFMVSDFFVLLTLALVLSVVGAVLKKDIKTVLYPLRLWPIFLFIMLIYLGFSYGKRIEFLPFLTYEGVSVTVSQILRVWTWVMCGLILKKFRFNEIVYSFLKKIYPSHIETLLSGLLALEYFPEVIGYAKSKECLSGLNFLKNPSFSLNQFVTRIQNYVLSTLNSGIKQVD
ncbi:MAG: Gx transporter family protein, partial [Fibrobacter sp.]|nr:Gx transporter family protein [Fibrobacter sp.]